MVLSLKKERLLIQPCFKSGLWHRHGGMGGRKLEGGDALDRLPKPSPALPHEFLTPV